MTTDQILLGVGLILVLAVGSQVLASRLRVPALIVLLPAGFAAGAITSDVNPERLLGAAFQPLVSLAVAVILYDAGLALDLGSLPPGPPPPHPRRRGPLQRRRYRLRAHPHPRNRKPPLQLRLPHHHPGRRRHDPARRRHPVPDRPRRQADTDNHLSPPAPHPGDTLVLLGPDEAGEK
jgi:hypothetical protein